MKFVPGQLVVWAYHERRSGRHRLVDGEVMQSGSVRMRIRGWNVQGASVLRWVKPENICPKQGGEPRYFYPGSLV